MPNRGVREVSNEDDLLSYQQTARQTSQELLIEQLADLSSGDEDKIHSRGAIVPEDLDVNTQTLDDAIVETDDPVWEAAPGSDEEGDWFGWYAFDSDEGLDDKTAVVYGFQLLDNADDAECDITALRVRNRTGGLIDEIDLSSIVTAEGKTLLYQDPLVLSNKKAYFEAYVEDGGADSTIPLKPLVMISEEEGDTLEGSSRFLSAQ